MGKIWKIIKSPFTIESKSSELLSYIKSFEDLKDAIKTANIQEFDFKFSLPNRQPTKDLTYLTLFWYLYITTFQYL